MRFTLIGISLIMAGVLALALFATNAFRRESRPVGHSIALVVLRSSDRAALKRAFEDKGAPSLRALRQKGVSFLHLGAPSTWYPSTIASLLTGLHPSEHGLHPSHAHLTDEAMTLAERLKRVGFETYAAVGADSLLEDLYVLQGFRAESFEEPWRAVQAFLAFLKDLPENRPFFALVDVNLDAFGGPGSFDRVFHSLYAGLGGDRFLDKGLLAISAPAVQEVSPGKDSAVRAPWIPFILAGAPLRLGPGKLFLKPFDLCGMESLLLETALGHGFQLRDSVRTGAPVVLEWIDSAGSIPVEEVNVPPPYFYRAVRFDDRDTLYILPPFGPARLIGSDGRPVPPDSDDAVWVIERFQAWLGGRTILNDLNIPCFAGRRLDAGLARRLGAPWNRSEFAGRRLHAVEHFRMGRSFAHHGYHALAAAEFDTALILDPDFAKALLELSRIHAGINPKRARELYRTFLDRFGADPSQRAAADEAQRYLK